MGDQALLKKKAAERAVEFVQSGMVVGLGTGSTTGFALDFSSTLVGGLLPANPHQQRIRFWKCSKCSATEGLFQA